MRLNYSRPADNILRYYDYYKFTPNLKEIWPAEEVALIEQGRFFNA
jgi:hypothetical protein